jgi:hypothetical protein
MERLRKKTGRPPLREGEVAIHKVMRWPPSLWAELEAMVPDRQRSAFIRRCVERGLAAEKRRREKAAEKTGQDEWEAARRAYDDEPRGEAAEK